jgi:aspartate aminotransferase/aminotransferase
MPRKNTSTRADSVDASGIRKVFDLAANLKDPINLSIGLPDFDVPEVAKEAAIRAIRQGHNRYTQTQGIAPLRERIHHDLKNELGRDPGEILITSGVSGGLLLAVMACVDPGDEVIFLDPYFVMYKHVVNMCGGKSVIIDSYPDFRFPKSKVAAAVTEKTKLIMLNSPANPTGAVLSEQDVRDAVEIAKKHDLLLLSDEIYEPFLYDVPRTGDYLYSPAKIYPKTILLRGFSKSHAMTGWRLGYAAGPDDVINAMGKLQQYTFVCAPSPFQEGALAAIDVDMTPYVTAYKRKRDLVFDMLKDKFELVKPGGAFYSFPKVPRNMKASDWVPSVIEKNVLVIPGNVFSERDTHFRISYATTDERLKLGCEILRSLA